MTLNCATCAYASKPKDGRRSCMRHPPVILNAVVAYNLSVSRGDFSRRDIEAATAYPIVTDVNVCGEWQPRDPEPPRPMRFREIMRQRQGAA